MRYRVLGMTVLSWGMLSTSTVSGRGAVDAEPKVYVEFLWSKPVEGALARQETRSFVLEPGFDHQVCVAVLTPGADVHGLVLEGLDARGEVVSRQAYPDFDGAKRCYPAMLPADGEPGKWAYRVYVDGRSTVAASKPVDVARTLQGATFHAPSSMPYVLGRPNYDDTIAPDSFVGRLVWVMRVDASGKVTQVEIEQAEGVGEQMRQRALAAGYLSLFPPDPSRGTAGITFRRELAFRPD